MQKNSISFIRIHNVLFILCFTGSCFFAAIPFCDANSSIYSRHRSSRNLFCQCSIPEVTEETSSPSCTRCRKEVMICLCRNPRHGESGQCSQCGRLIIAEKESGECTCTNPEPVQMDNGTWLCRNCSKPITPQEELEAEKAKVGIGISDAERQRRNLERERRRLERERRRLELERKRLEKLLQQEKERNDALDEQRKKRLEDALRQQKLRESALQDEARRAEEWERYIKSRRNRLDERRKYLENLLRLMRERRANSANGQPGETNNGGASSQPGLNNSSSTPPATAAAAAGYGDHSFGLCCIWEFLYDTLWRWWRDNPFFEFMSYLGRVLFDQEGDITNQLQPTARDTVIIGTYAFLDSGDDPEAAATAKDLFLPGVIKQNDVRQIKWMKILGLKRFIEFGNTVYSDADRAAIPYRWYLLRLFAPKDAVHSIITLRKINDKWKIDGYWTRKECANYDFTRLTFYDEPCDDDSRQAEKIAMDFCREASGNDFPNAFRYCLKNSPLRSTSTSIIRKRTYRPGLTAGSSAAPWQDVRIVPMGILKGHMGLLAFRVVMEKRCGTWYVSKIID